MKQRYSDEELVELLSMPDTQRVDAAISYLYEQHKSMLVRLVRTKGGSQEEADEIVDDALVGLWKAVRAGRYQPTAQLKTYLYQIARNQWLKRVREAGRRIAIVDIESVDEQLEIPPESLEGKEWEEQFWKRVRNLGETCYNVLRAFAEGYTMQEIADRFQLGTANNAKTIKYNCLRRLGGVTNE